MKDIPDGSIDMVLTDPPFGVTRNDWDSIIPIDKMWNQLNRIVKPNGAIIIFGQGMFTANCMRANKKYWRYNIIWQKTNPVGFLNANRMPLRSHEDIMVFYKKLPVYHPQKSSGHERKTATAAHKRNCNLSSDYGIYAPVTYTSTERYPTSVWTYAKDIQKSALHPTQKPLLLCEDLIKSFSDEGDTVLDFATGSGSTGVACINTGRNFIGIELDENYFHIATDRIAEAQAKKKAEDAVHQISLWE